MSIYEEFEWRGLVYGSTEGARELLTGQQVTCYVGFDATASSLHLGHLLPILALARAQRFGHTPIAVIGEGTGLIGDPSGKSTERTLLTIEETRLNAEGVRAQLSKFLEFRSGPNPARLVNNAEWLIGMTAMEFLRDVGKCFTVNYMLSKESVKRRIESEDGISYTEFSYLVLQAYDFLVLHDRFNCTLQMGGSDQWGNIVAGCDLIRKLRGANAHGLVLPLVTTAGGTKFGKTEAGTVWLDPARTSPFRFYQFWLNVDDRDAVRYLKYFTFTSREEIAELEETMARAPERREAQRKLAGEVTQLVHGHDQCRRVERASALLFGDGISEANLEDVLMVFEDAPSSVFSAERFADPGIPLVDVLVHAKLASSKGEAARLVRSGGVYVNNRRVSDERVRLNQRDAVGGQVVVLRKGARHYHVVRLGEP